MLFLLMLLAGQLLTGQDEHGAIFAPFVSRLKTRSSESGVVLTWQNSTDLAGWARIYRHTEEISAASLHGAELIARLDPGEQSYADHPPHEGTFFYAVLLEDESGEPYRLFIPFRNKTTAGISIHRTVTEEELAAEITDLRVETAGGTVTLRFSVSRSERDLLLFRGTSAIRTSENLLDASTPVVLPAGTASTVDSPIPGVEYFYAVVDAGLFRLGKASVQAGVNATVEAVCLAAEDERTGLPSSPVRSLPLPSLLPAAAAGIRVPDSRTDLQPATAQAVSALLAESPARTLPEMEIEILPVDTVGSHGGEEHALRTILDEHLSRSDYAGAEDLLNSFLSIPRPADLEARAHFYLGQARYFRQKNREAFLEFLVSEQHGYREAGPWLEACLHRISGTAGR